MSDLLLNTCIAHTILKDGFPTTLFKVDGLNREEAPQTLENLSDMGFKKHKIPCAGLINPEGDFIAFATRDMMPRRLTLGYEIQYKAFKFNEKFVLNPGYTNERRTIGNIISRALRHYLYRDAREEIWQRHKKQRIFCGREPDSIYEDIYGVYRCFKFRTDLFPDGRIGITIDPTTTILDNRNLFELYKMLSSDDFSELFKYIDSDKNGKYMILDGLGGYRRLVFVEGILTGKTIMDKIITTKLGDKQSPFDFYDGVNPFSNQPLDKSEPVALCKFFHGGKEIFYAPASCVHYVYSNYELKEDPVGRQLIMPTKERIMLTTKFSKYFSSLDAGVGNQPEYKLDFSRKFSNGQDFECNHIHLPLLRFGNGSLTEKEIEDKLGWNKVKRDALKRFGAYQSANIRKILMIHPSMKKGELDEYYEDIRQYALEWYEKLPDLYVPLETKDYIDILEKLNKYQSDYDAALIIFREYDDEIYSRIKSALKIPSQGATMRTIRSKQYFRKIGKEYRYRDNIMNIVSGLIGKSGGIPWILSNTLSCDCFIGVDSGGSSSRIWSYAYVFDHFGEYAGAGKGQAFKKEGLVKERFKNAIIGALTKRKDVIPKRIIIHRDGKIVETEKEGLIEAIDELISSGNLPEDVEYATVNIKKSTPFRIFERGDDGLGDCFIGSAFFFDENRAVIVTTGKPVITQGTSNPLLLELDAIKGNFDIRDVTKDIFYLSELNWGSPTKDVKLPITVRFAESMIEYADKNIEFSGTFPL